MAKSQIVKHVKKDKLRNAEYYDMQGIFDDLYSESQNNKIFTNLLDIIQSEENIKLAYRNIKKNTGSKTAGVDGRTIKSIATLTEEKFVQYTRNKFRDYKPKAVRRVEIPKPNGKTRPLGIPAIWDRIVQQCILQVLEPICEAKFYDRNNGFRPNRSVEQAIAQCYRFMQIVNTHYVVDIDIKGFFDNVNHGKLLKQMLTMGIKDKKLLTIISKMLKAKIKLPDGTIIENDKGTPQGGILSPLLSNIVLNELDWWIASQWETIPTKTKTAQVVDRGAKGIDRGNKYKVLRSKSNLKECYTVRYADDFKIFCKSYTSAKKMYFATKQWLKDRLGLDISEEKSSIINLQKNYSDFLGLKMKVIPKGKKCVVKSHMCDKAVSRTKENLKKIVKEIKYPKGSNDEIRKIGEFNATVVGLHQYFRIATMVSEDMANISYTIQHTLKGHKIHKRIQKTGNIKSEFVRNEYGRSKQLRFIRKTPFLPIGYIKHKSPMMKKRNVNQYTLEGRNLIHKNLAQVDMATLIYLMKHPVRDRSVEYNDNRLALYSAQKGKCGVTNEVIFASRIHCHHKIPREMNGGDEYQNLVLVDLDIHKLIHASDEETINKYKYLVEKDTRAIKRLNKLRKLTGREEILV